MKNERALWFGVLLLIGFVCIAWSEMRQVFNFLPKLGLATLAVWIATYIFHARTVRRQIERVKSWFAERGRATVRHKVFAGDRNIFQNHYHPPNIEEGH